MTRTVVNLVRHGEVQNPDGVLYGRLPGFVLSDLGHQMARATAAALAERDITHVVASPLERAQQTAQPLAEALGLPIVTDDRVIESENWFQGQTEGWKKPQNWRKLWNPLRPSWGEPHREIAARMRAAVDTAREQARGHEAAIISHQLPVWIARLDHEGRRLAHWPPNRECTLASVTALVFEDDRFVGVEYSEPSGHLLPPGARGKNFSGQSHT